MGNELTNRAKETIALQAERINLRSMADYVKEYIIAYCDEDSDFVKQVSNPEKSFMDCIAYIKKQALEWLKEQQKIELSSYAQGVGGDVPNDICYQWAIEYYYSKPEPKPESKKNIASAAKAGKGTASANKTADIKNKENSASAQLSLMDSLGEPSSDKDALNTETHKTDEVENHADLPEDNADTDEDNDHPDDCGDFNDELDQLLEAM